jgi:cyclophilin family peptidyl-prolyl cis-trans isomerase/HEAT repeat protein
MLIDKPTEVSSRALMLLLRTTAFCLVVFAFAHTAFGQVRSRARRAASVPNALMIRIVRAEDERRWDNELSGLLAVVSPVVRKRAALAAGRIGDERAVPLLVSLFQKDGDESVRAMAAFALGEVESGNASEALIAELGGKGQSPKLRARTVEALGKIAAGLPKTAESRKKSANEAILAVLADEASRRSDPNVEVILLGLTAALRGHPEGAGKVIAEFLTFSDSRIRADAGNALARLRAKEGNEQLQKLLTNDPDSIVRANAARVLGATEEKAAFDGLLDRALNDTDSRVRVSAIRALTALKVVRAAQNLLAHLGQPPANVVASPDRLPRRSRSGFNTLDGVNTLDGNGGGLLEIAVSLGRLLQGTENSEALSWLKTQRERFTNSAPEVEIALVRIYPQQYLAELGVDSIAKHKAQEILLVNWRGGSSLAQGLGEIAALPDSVTNLSALAAQAQEILRAMLDYRNSVIKPNTPTVVHPEYAIPDVLRALAAFKPKDLRDALIKHLRERDVVIRATAAELLGELPPDRTNANALSEALIAALADRDLNDAALAILDALAKQKTEEANSAIRTALESKDHLIRRRAVSLLKANSSIDFSARIGTVQTTNNEADYQRAIARIGKTVRASVVTTKGAFIIELLPEDAPLNVDNFIQLAKRGYFNGITFHRVVPNFVVQGGDPRGDGNGGPGYQIRCEINEVPYERGAVGMALSGKDTGGSQWFVTHSPQSHLDGGYTVFGRVVTGMEVVDSLVRGDLIRSVVVSERPRRRPHSTGYGDD